jgi:hypothetical protein
VLAAVPAVSTPFFWLLDNPDTGQLVAASVQGATGIAALAWALTRFPANALPGAEAIDTGEGRGTVGGRAAGGDAIPAPCHTPS